VNERLQQNNSDYKRGENNWFSLLFKAGFFVWRWRVILVSVDWPNDKLLFEMLSKIYQEGALFLTH